MNFKEFINQYQKVPVEHYPNTVSEKPLVSVCVQTYQHVNFIKECLDGILMQETNFNFEVLLGDDASTDGTREICIEYAEKYPDKIRLFLHHRENNISIRGQPTGRFNFVYNLFLAKGKYIALCEGDDYWTDPNKLQKQVDFLEENEEYVACFHGCMHVNEKSEVIKASRYKHYSDSSSKKLITAEAAMITHTVLYRNVIKDFPSFFFDTSSGDTLLYHLLGFYGDAKFLDDINYSAYRVHKGGIWSGVSSIVHIECNINTLKAIRKNLLKEDREDLIQSLNNAMANRLNHFLIKLIVNEGFIKYVNGLRVAISQSSVPFRIIRLHTKTISNKLFKFLFSK